MIRPLRIDQDSQPYMGPLLYYGGILKATAGGISTADLFDNTSPASFPLDSFRAAASSVDRSFPPVGIFVLRGIAVDLGANVDYLLVYVDDDVPEDTAGPQGAT